MLSYFLRFNTVFAIVLLLNLVSCANEQDGPDVADNVTMNAGAQDNPMETEISVEVPPPQKSEVFSMHEFPVMAPFNAESIYSELVAEIGTEPQMIFNWVKENVRTVVYSGSVKGGVGALLSMSGNSLDKSDLLQCLLASTGHTAHLVHGTLDPEATSELVDSMYGYMSDVEIDWNDVIAENLSEMGFSEEDKDELSAAISEIPVTGKNGKLEEIARDHWWVELETENGTVSYDTCIEPEKPGVGSCAAVGVYDSVPDEFSQVTTIELTAVYADGTRVPFYNLSARSKDLISDFLILRFEKTSEDNGEFFHLIVNNVPISESKAPMSMGDDNFIDSMSLCFATDDEVCADYGDEITVWTSKNGTVPDESVSVSIAGDSGGSGLVLAGNLKPVYEKANPAQAAIPQNSIISGLMNQAQQGIDQNRPVVERVRMRSLSDAMMASFGAGHFSALCTATAGQLGVPGYMTHPRFGVATRNERDDSQLISLTILGTTDYVPGSEMPDYVHTGLEYSEIILRDIEITALLENMTGAQVISYSSALTQAVEEGTEFVSFSDRNQEEIGSYGYYGDLEQYIYEGTSDGAIILTTASPIVMNGTEYYPVTTIHSFLIELLTEGDINTRLVEIWPIADRYELLRDVIYAGVCVYSMAQIFDSMSGALGGLKKGVTPEFHTAFYGVVKGMSNSFTAYSSYLLIKDPSDWGQFAKLAADIAAAEYSLSMIGQLLKIM